MLETLKKWNLRRIIRSNAAAIDGCRLEIAKIEAEIEEREQRMKVAGAELREMEFPVRVRSAFK